MQRGLEEHFEDFVAKRCDEALTGDQKYMKREQSDTADSVELQTLAEVLCYKKGFKDAMMILEGIQ